MTHISPAVTVQIEPICFSFSLLPSLFFAIVLLQIGMLDVILAFFWFGRMGIGLGQIAKLVLTLLNDVRFKQCKIDYTFDPFLPAVGYKLQAHN